MADDNTSVGKISLDIDISQELEKQIDNASKNVAEELQSGIEKGLDVSGLLKSFTSNIENTVKTSMDNIQRVVESSLKNVDSNINNVINTTRDKAIKGIDDISAALKKLNVPQQNFTSSFAAATPKTVFGSNRQSGSQPSMGISEKAQAQIDLLSRKMDIFSDKADIAREKVNELNTQIKELSRDTGSPVQNQVNTYTIEKLKQELAKAAEEEENFAIKSDGLNLKIQTLTEKMNTGANATNRNTKAVHSKADSLQKASDKGSIFSNVLSKLTGRTNEAANSTKSHGSIMDRLGLSFDQVGRMMDRMLIRMVIFNTVINGLSTMATFIGNALETNTQFSNSLLEIKTNLMTAFMPIYNACLPAINSLISGLATATTYIASFVSALFGTTYQASNVAAQGMQSQIGALDIAEKQAKKTADSLGGVAKKSTEAGNAAKTAGEKARAGIMGFDEVNQLQDKSTKTPSEKTGPGSGVVSPIAGGVGGLAGIGAETSTWAESFKKSLSGLFTPFQQSWAAEGQNTITDFKYALGGIESLIGSIAKSFATVWENGTGTSILENSYKILQDIFNIVGLVGNQWANAWNNGDIGTKIVQDLGSALNNVLGLFDKVGESIQKVFAQEGPTFANLFMQALKGTSGVIEDITEKMGWIWDHGGQHAFEGLVKLGIKIGELALLIYNQFVVPFVTWFTNMISPAIAGVLDILGSVFDVMSSIISWLMGSGKPALDVIVTTIGSIVLGIKAINTTKSIISGVVDTFKAFRGGVTGAFKAFKSGIETAYLKALYFKDGVAKVGSTIADVGKDIVDFGTKIAKIAWDGAVKGATALGNSLKTIGIAALDGAKALGELIVSLAKTAAGFIKSAAEATAHTIVLGAHKIATLASAAAEVVLQIAQVALNLVMSLNPIGLVVIAIGALVAAVVIAYNKSETFRNAVNNLWNNVLVPFGNFLKGTFVEAWNAVRDTVKWLWNNVFALFENFIKDMWNNVLVPFGKFLAETFVSSWNAVKDAVNWLWDKIFVPFKDFLKSLWDTILVPFAKFLTETFVGAWNAVKSAVDLLWNNVFVPFKSFLSSIWNNIFVPFGTFLSITFVTAWNDVKSVIKSFWDDVLTPVGDAVKNIWDNTFVPFADFLGTTFKTVWGDIGDAIMALKTPINWIISAMNKFIDYWDSLKFTVPSINIGGKEVGGFSVGMPYIGHVPALARGGIIDEPTLAFMGEGHKKEAVVPLENTAFVDTLASAVANAVLSAARFMNSNNSNNATSQKSGNITLQIDGKTIARVLNPYLDSEKQRLGSTMIIKTV